MAYTEEQLKAFATTLGQQPRTPPELVDASLSHEPATVARDLSLSQRTGIDPALAGDYADSIARSDIQKAYDDLAVSAPRSHTWASQDAYNMALMRDSLQQAQLIEGYLHQQQQEEAQDAAVAARGIGSRAADIATGAWVSAGSILPRTASGLFGAQRAFTEALIEPAAKAALRAMGRREATPISDFFKERQAYYGKMAEELGGVAGEQLQAGGVTPGVVSGFQMLGQVGMMLAAPEAALPTMVASVLGEEYGAARDKGKGVIPSLAFGAGQGAIEYGTEKFAIGKFLEAAKNGKPLAKAAVEMAAKEIPGEQLATFFQDLNTAAVLNPDRPLAEFWAERPNAAMQTLVATLIGGGGAVTVSTAMDAIAGRLEQNVNALAGADQEKRMDSLRAATAESNFNRLKDLAAAADAAPIRALHDGKFREWIESAARESDLAEVYVNGAILRGTLSESGVTGAQLQAAAPEVAAQISDALATNGDVRIALPELLSSTFDAKLREALMPHVKTDPQGMTYQESQGYFQNQVQELEQRAQQIAEEAAPVMTREEYEADQAMLTTEADIVAEGQAAIDELTTTAAQGNASPEQVAELATLQDLAGKPDALAQYFGKTITGEAPKSYDEYLAAHSNTAEVRAREVSGLRNEIVASMRSMNRFPDSVVSAYATPLTEFYLTQSAALGITPSALREMLPLSFAADSLMGGYTQDKPFEGSEIAKKAVQDARERAASIFDTNRWLDIGLKLGKGAKIYRGEDSNTGRRSANEGVGLYTTTDRKQAEGYGAVREMSREALPKNPIRFRDVATFNEWERFVARELGFNRPSDMQAEFGGGVDVWARAIKPEVDGVQIGTGHGAFFVRWRDYDSNFQQAPRPFEGSEIAKTPLAEGQTTIDVDGTERPALNSKGQPIHWSQEGIRNFWRWFSDSKVVDAEGRPLVVYHGTNAAFMVFDQSGAKKRRHSVGGETAANSTHWFTSNRNLAIKFANGGMQGRFLYPENFVVEAYLRAENPITQDMAQERLSREEKGWSTEHGIEIGFRKEKIVREARIEGRDAVIFHNALDGDSTYGGSVFGVFKPEQIKSAIGNTGAFDPANPNILMQSGAAQPRGYLDPASLTMGILQGADLSTVLHESGHFYLEALRTLASHPNAPQLMKDDWAKTLKWFGVADTATWDAMSLEEKRPYHEQWAQSQERWMLEGKAPTLEMQPVFARFRAWLLNVYKSLEEFLRQNPLAGRLDDDMRGVFSRLIASEDAIREAERARGYAAMPQPDGVTDAEYARYMALGEEATADAIENMQRRSVKDMQWMSNAKNKAIRKLQREADTKRKAIRAEVTAEVMAEPVSQARTFLRTGETVDPATGDLIKAEVGAKLNTAAVKELFPESALAAPNLAKLRGMTSPEGLHPDLVAQMFGYRSGEALVLDLIDAEKAEDKITGLTDQRMLERHGELIDPAAVERAAESEIHNEARAKFMATGLQMLTKSPMPVREMVRAATEAAQNTIARKKVRDLRPKQFEAAEARANKKAIAEAPRDPAKAAEAQRAALLNNRMARASTDALEEVEKALRYVAKFQSEGTRKNLDLEYLEQIDALLAPFDMRAGQSLKAIDKRKSLSEWIAKQESLGYEPAIDVDTAEDAKRKHYKDMTLEELRGLLDAVQSVEHLGRLKKKLLTAKDKREFAERIQEAITSIKANANREVFERATPSDVVGTVGKWWGSMLASHRKFASIIREMDGSHDNGVMWNLLVRSMNEAGDNETEMKAQATEKVAALFQPVMKHMGGMKAHLKAQRRVVPGTNLSMTYEERIMFALNWGNEGNRQRLLDGGLSGKLSLTLADAEAVIDTLDKADWEFVQGVWDFVGSYRQQIGEQERRITGKEPKWIEASPVVTKFGTYPGGYFPAKYDADLSTRSESLEAATNLRMGMKGAFGAAATRNGYTQQRSEEVSGRPLLLSFNAITTHVNEVVHRLAWQDWLFDANRVLRSLDGTVRDHYGPEILKELRETVKDIAQGDAPATSPVEQAINRLRAGSTIVGMGWRVTTALLQPSGLAQSWVRVGGPWMVKGVAQYAADPFGTSAMVNEKSKLMRDRGRTMYREINEIMNTVRVGEKVSALHASYFSLIAKMQRTVDIPTWLGAYEKAAAKLKLEEAGTPEARKAIDEQCVAIADQAVIDAQSGGQLKDLARVQRGSPIFKLFTNFYSYFSATYNLNVEAYRRTDFKSPTEVGMFAVDMLILNTLPVLFSVALKELMKGGCQDDDMECLANRVAHEQLSFLIGQMVLLREAGAAVEVATGGEGFGYKGPAGLRFFGDLYSAGQQVGQGEADMAAFKAVNSVAGAVLHYPAGQINSTMEGIIAVENGDVEGAAVLPALIAGKPRAEE